MGILLALSAVVAPFRSVHASELQGGHLVVSRTEDAADCPDEAALTEATLALGTLPATPAEPLEIEVSFRREAAGYAAEVRASGRTEGIREVAKEGQTCTPLAEAVSVVLAVLLDLRPRDPTPAPVAVAPAPPPARAEAAPVPPPAKPSEPSPTFAVGVGVEGGASFRVVGDGFAGTVALAVRPRLDRWEGSLGGLWAPYGSTDYAEHSIHMSLLSARLGGCAWLDGSRSRLDAGLCAGFSVGNLRAEGRGFAPNVPASDAWFAFDVGVAGRLPITRKWAARLTISAVIPTRTQTYTAAGLTDVVQTSPAGALVGLGPELTFP